MSTFVIGDIHGCLKTFRAMLEKITFSKDDCLYILGDYIDRGPNSKGVIDTIWGLQESGYTIHCLKGNHEQMLIKNANDQEQTEMYHKATLRSFGVTTINDIPNDYIRWMYQLPYCLTYDKFIFVHAGFKF